MSLTYAADWLYRNLSWNLFASAAYTYPLSTDQLRLEQQNGASGIVFLARLDEVQEELVYYPPALALAAVALAKC